MEYIDIGQEVVRTKGDYVVGRIGEVIDIDNDLKRVRVDWVGENKTWVSFGSLALTSIPYKIIRPDPNRKRRMSREYPKYVLL